MSAARTIVENRVNGLGVSEAVVQQAGDRRILVEIPGASDAQKALESIQKTGLLEFVDIGDLSSQEALALENTVIQTDFETAQQPGCQSHNHPGTIPGYHQHPVADPDRPSGAAAHFPHGDDRCGS